MEDLSLDNIMSEEEINNLFTDDVDTEETTEESTEENKETKEDTEFTEVNPEELFKDSSESVGNESDEDKQGKEDTSSTEETSPDNFYSSIANALVEDGIFQDLESKSINDIKSSDDFAEYISEQVRLQLDERQRRIDEALGYGVEPSEIQKYESYLRTLDSITEDALEAETTDGENLRKNIIYQDYINRGFSKERAVREVERSINSGSDIEDAKEALQSNIEYYNSVYSELIEDSKLKAEKDLEEQEQQTEAFRESILNEKEAFGEIPLDKTTRQKVYDSIMKPIYTDPDTGERLSAIQKHERTNRTDFLKNLGLVYVLTDGFKKLDGLVGGKVKKEVKKGLKELENTINNTSRNTSGSLDYMSGIKDPNSRYTNWEVDI